MNLIALFSLAQAANVDAAVSISQARDVIIVTWKWPGKDLQDWTKQIRVPVPSLESDRYPFFAVRGYLQMAADAMAELGGKPDRTHELFRPTTDVQSYAQQRDILEMKFNTGIINSYEYVDSMIQLITKRDRDNGWWPNGANRR
jgi:hypothetical protein